MFRGYQGSVGETWCQLDGLPWPNQRLFTHQNKWITAVNFIVWINEIGTNQFSNENMCQGHYQSNTYYIEKDSKYNPSISPPSREDIRCHNQVIWHYDDLQEEAFLWYSRQRLSVVFSTETYNLNQSEKLVAFYQLAGWHLSKGEVMQCKESWRAFQTEEDPEPHQHCLLLLLATEMSLGQTDRQQCPWEYMTVAMCSCLVVGSGQINSLSSNVT